jgi:hypothetical protein
LWLLFERNTSQYKFHHERIFVGFFMKTMADPIKDFHRSSDDGMSQVAMN